MNVLFALLNILLLTGFGTLVAEGQGEGKRVRRAEGLADAFPLNSYVCLAQLWKIDVIFFPTFSGYH